MNTFALLAQTADGGWLDTSVGRVLRAILAGVGLILVIAAGARGASKLMSGKAGDAFRTFFSAAVLAVFLFRPTLIMDLAGLIGDVISELFSSAETVVDNCTSDPINGQSNCDI